MIQFQQEVTFEEKQIHKQPITGIHQSLTDQNLFLTISEDQTMRLYDLRLNSSIKLFQFPQSENSNQTANCLLSEHNAFGVRDNQIIKYDIRNGIIIKDIQQYQECDSEINQITFDQSQQIILANCDSGNSFIFDHNLNLKTSLLNGHKTVCFTGDFILDEGKLCCLTSGFDYCIILWDFMNKEQANIIHNTNLNAIHAQYSGYQVTPPIVYSLSCSSQSETIASTETGQIYNFGIKELKYKKNKKPPKPNYVIDAHTTKVMRSIFIDENKILSISNDKSFGIWNKEQQLLKVSIPNKPNWVEYNKFYKKVIVADVTNKLYMYLI